MSRDDNFPPEPVHRNRRPAGQALVVVLVSLLVACLLNADRLDYTAHTQPLGSWQREWALRVTGPLKSISHATRLNRPRQWLTEGVGNEDPPPPDDTRTVVTAPPLVEIDGRLVPSTTTPVSTTSTTPPKPRTITPDEPLRVLVVGDSLMGLVGPAMVDLFGNRPVQVREDWEIATGLARPDVKNWPAQVEQDMEDYDPEVLVIGFGGNDAQSMQNSDGILKVGSKEWGAEYQRRVAQILNAAEGRGRTVYWIGMPMTTRSNIERAAPLMARAVRTEIAARPWAHYVDTRKILTPDGVYTQYLPDGGGGQVKVREGDGVHPTRAGASRIVAPVVESVIKERDLF